MFDNTVFHVMRVVLQEHSSRWAAKVPDLTKPQYAVLEALDIAGEMDQAALGAASATTKATLTEMLGRMEQRGLIARQIDPADTRRRVVQLTEAGRDRLGAARPVAAAVTESMLQCLTVEERGQLTAMLADIRRATLSDAPQSS
ncbi:MarR family transcriptional regulator [Afifella sp. JA880]|uniref:MarR family winged helix-turn-helix transcriptional regulator n=1 Tax=Afifella sp. JA880 TaxID=2975280 RepID=UPI0021BB6844|nr:MarR family transcriptional regulator [Afifella sp. JA880]MCT8266461.1 MarR family transcriptional regulator [Afifella sp. JA880]